MRALDGGIKRGLSANEYLPQPYKRRRQLNNDSAREFVVVWLSYLNHTSATSMALSCDGFSSAE